ncbi:MAG: hypothetical protein AB1597_06750 [Chloroflexota bacterium]
MTSIETLVREGSIHPFRATQEEIAKVIDIAKRDLAESEAIQARNVSSLFRKICQDFINEGIYRQVG